MGIHKSSKISPEYPKMIKDDSQKEKNDENEKLSSQDAVMTPKKTPRPVLGPPGPQKYTRVATKRLPFPSGPKN